MNSRYIRGYCIPDYASKAEPQVENKFVEETKEEPAVETPVSQLSGKPIIDSARFFLKARAGEYAVTASWLNVRTGAGTTKPILTSIPHGSKVRCYGYFSLDGEKEWLYIAGIINGERVEGFCSSTYLSKQ